jgi:hypothetical protein
MSFPLSKLSTTSTSSATTTTTTTTMATTTTTATAATRVGIRAGFESQSRLKPQVRIFYLLSYTILIVFIVLFYFLRQRRCQLGSERRRQGLGRRGLGLETRLEPKVRVFFIFLCFFYTNRLYSSILLITATTTTAGIRETSAGIRETSAGARDAHRYVCFIYM